MAQPLESKTKAKDVGAPQPPVIHWWQSRLRRERSREAEGSRSLANLHDEFPLPESVIGGSSELRRLADGIDNHLMEIQYRSGSVTAPLTVALFVLIPTSVFAVLPALGGALDVTRGILLIALLVLVGMIVRYAETTVGWLTSHRDQLRWLLARRQAYLAEIRRLDAEEASLRRSEDLALLTELLRATQRRRRWL